VGEVGNALRIYTVHEAKGLEAPIVWLLDANDTQSKTDSYSVLLDWQPNAPRPSHFSLFSDKRGHGAKRARYFDADEAYARREEMNLLYVAMTRAKQALLVSGNGEPAETSWYGRIAHVVERDANPLSGRGGQRCRRAGKITRERGCRIAAPVPDRKTGLAHHAGTAARHLAARIAATVGPAQYCRRQGCASGTVRHPGRRDEHPLATGPGIAC